MLDGLWATLSIPYPPKLFPLSVTRNGFVFYFSWLGDARPNHSNTHISQTSSLLVADLDACHSHSHSHIFKINIPPAPAPTIYSRYLSVHVEKWNRTALIQHATTKTRSTPSQQPAKNISPTSSGYIASHSKPAKCEGSSQRTKIFFWSN